MDGIEKHIDDLGRVVIPKKFRNKLGLEKDSKVFVSLNNNVIRIRPADTLCVLCDNSRNVNAEIRLCGDCIKKVVEFERSNIKHKLCRNAISSLEENRSLQGDCKGFLQNHR